MMANPQVFETIAAIRIFGNEDYVFIKSWLNFF